MSADLEPGRPGGLSRRALLAGAPAALAVLVTAGCDSDTGVSLPSIPGLAPEQQDNPDLPRVQDALAGEEAVLAAVQQVQRRQRTLRKALAATAAVHQSHVDLLRSAAEDAASPSPSPSPPVARVPRDPAAAVAALVRLERKLAADHVDTAMGSRSGVLARVVASMSAAAAQQAVVVGALPVRSAKEAGQ